MANAKHLTLLQMNDSHAYFDLHQESYWHPNAIRYARAGGFGRIAAIAAAIRRETGGALLFLDNGDTLHGTAPAVRTRGKAMVPVLNALGIAAMTGHWEFAYGPEELTQRIGEMQFPFLAANVYRKGTSNPVYKGYAVLEAGALRIGVIGVAAYIVDKTMPASFHTGLAFTLGEEELPGIVQRLRTQEKTDLIVLLSHLGLPQDVKLLSRVPGIDVCLSGHTHNRLFQPIRQGTTIIIQSGSHGSFLGRLDLDVEGAKVVGERHCMISVDETVSPDAGMESMVQEILATVGSDLNSVVGDTRLPLDRATMLESTMDNFLLAAVLETTDAEIAFSNGWRFGAPVVPGHILLNDLYNMVPMDPPISVAVLSGREILSMLEENLERTFAGDPYRQMGGYVKRCAGLRSYIKIENPAGTRIQAVFVRGKPLEPERRYQTAFITEQGVPEKYGEQRRQTGEHCVGALHSYLARHSPVAFPLEGTFIAV